MRESTPSPSGPTLAFRASARVVPADRCVRVEIAPPLRAIWGAAFDQAELALDNAEQQRGGVRLGDQLDEVGPVAVGGLQLLPRSVGTPSETLAGRM